MSGQSQSQAISSRLPLLGSTTVSPSLELCSSDPETHNSNCSSWPLGLPSRYDLFRSDRSGRLIRTPKRREQSHKQKSSPVREPLQMPPPCLKDARFYTCNKRICSHSLLWFLLLPRKCTVNLTKVT